MIPNTLYCRFIQVWCPHQSFGSRSSEGTALPILNAGCSDPVGDVGQPPKIIGGPSNDRSTDNAFCATSVLGRLLSPLVEQHCWNIDHSRTERHVRLNLSLHGLQMCSLVVSVQDRRNWQHDPSCQPGPAPLHPIGLHERQPFGSPNPEPVGR